MRKEQNEARVSTKRFRYILAIAALFIVGIVFLAYRAQLLLDELLCLITVNVVFAMVFALGLMKKRLMDKLPQGQSTSYRRIFIILLVCWVFEIAFTFCPIYFAPVMMICVLLTTVLDEGLALSLGIYFNIVTCITSGFSNYVLCCYCILCVFGVLLSSFLVERTREESLYIYVLFFLLNISIPIVFYYIAFLELNTKVFLYGVFDGLINCAFIIIGFLPLYHRAKDEKELNYYVLIQDDYPLVKDIKKYSMAEYHHAKRVSKLSAICAKEINANADVTACAGFYYRLGKMEGEPEIDNAIRLATNHCFPQDVILIMEEYAAILRLPQTPESAIVHMVDALVTKIEILDRDTMSSTWNQDMVIYQTLNELSQKGLYDESGLSMNQFLKIRERLVQEDSVL